MSIADALELILATGLDLNPGNCPVMLVQSTKACSHYSFGYGVRGVTLSLWLAEIYGNLGYVGRWLGLANAVRDPRQEDDRKSKDPALSAVARPCSANAL